ncbi:MAG: Ig-like domain-containing protein [Clostridia bacterium]|nr:Ig-like domain-containing protein [Clostridia bacterium]
MTRKMIFTSALLTVAVLLSAFTCNLTWAYGAEKEDGQIVTGQRYYNKDRTNLKKCDVVDYIEIDMLPFGMSVQTPSNVTSRYPGYRNHNALIPNGNIEYKFHKDDKIFSIIRDKHDPKNMTKAAIQIKKAGKIKVTITKPETKNEKAVTRDIVITVVDKREKTKISGLKPKYVKKVGSKSFNLNAVQYSYSLYYGKFMTYKDWVKAIKEEYGAYNSQYRGYNELFPYPYFKSDNPAVATVDSKGNVKLKKPGKATITAQVHLRKQFGWAEADGDPGRVFNKPVVKKTVVIVKPNK